MAIFGQKSSKIQSSRSTWPNRLLNSTRRSGGTGGIGHSSSSRRAIFAKIASDTKTPPGQIGARLWLPKPPTWVTNRTTPTHQVDIDLHGPRATRWARVAFFNRPLANLTWPRKVTKQALRRIIYRAFGSTSFQKGNAGRSPPLPSLEGFALPQ